MPPTSQTKAPPERPPDKVSIVRVGDLIPSLDTNRSKANKSDLNTLACSIASVGIIQPLVARPHPKQKGKLDLRAGSRRLTAAIMLDMETVPVIVRDTMTDAEAVEITVTENLSRENLHPIDEGCAIAQLLEVGLSADDVADKLGRSAGWVLRRAQLQHLHLRFVELNAKPGHPFADVPVGLLLQLARLPLDVQKGMASEISKAATWLPAWAQSVDNCEDYIAHEVLMDLRRTIWKLDDEALYPKAGACTACPKRSKREPRLFDDITWADGKADAPGKCLDRDCFNEKHRRALKGKIAKAKSSNPDVVLITQAAPQIATDEAAYFGRPVLQSYAVTKVKKGAKGAVAAVVLSGKGAGTITHVRPPTTRTKGDRATRPTAATMTLQQKRKALNARRLAWVIDRLAAIVDEHLEVLTRDTRPKFLTEGLLCDHLADLSVAFLMPEPDDMPAAGKGAWDRADTYRKGPPGVKQYELVMVTAVLQCWANRLQRHGTVDLGQYEADTVNMARYLDVELSELVKQAAKELPEPKGWADDKKPAAVKKTKKIRKRYPR